MKKLEKKQIPVVLACGAVTVAALGYTSFQMANQPIPKPTPPRNVTGAAATATPAAAPVTAGAPIAPVTAEGRTELARFTAVPPSYTGDPFSPVFKEQNGLEARTKHASQAMKQFGQALGKAFSGFGRMFGERVNMNAPQLPPGGEWTPAVLQDHPRTAELTPEEAMGGVAPGGPGGAPGVPQPTAGGMDDRWGTATARRCGGAAKTASVLRARATTGVRARPWPCTRRACRRWRG